jgi:hypothetical protein
MTTKKLDSLQDKSIQLMEQGYTCAEASLRVLLEAAGCNEPAHHWTAAGYMGAITSGKTICGCVFGGTVFLGLVHGLKTSQLPVIGGEKRSQAVASVEQFYLGFIERFGDTDCFKLTGIDWGNRKDVVRYFKEEVYQDTCYRFMQYVLSSCLDLSTTGSL